MCKRAKGRKTVLGLRLARCADVCGCVVVVRVQLCDSVRQEWQTWSGGCSCATACGSTLVEWQTWGGGCSWAETGSGGRTLASAAAFVWLPSGCADVHPLTHLKRTTSRPHRPASRRLQRHRTSPGGTRFRCARRRYPRQTTSRRLPRRWPHRTTLRPPSRRLARFRPSVQAPLWDGWLGSRTGGAGRGGSPSVRRGPESTPLLPQHRTRRWPQSGTVRRALVEGDGSPSISACAMRLSHQGAQHQHHRCPAVPQQDGIDGPAQSRTPSRESAVFAGRRKARDSLASGLGHGQVDKHVNDGEAPHPPARGATGEAVTGMGGVG
jgi:hypothetical protein